MIWSAASTVESPCSQPYASKNRPASSTGISTGKSWIWPSSKSSCPAPGAMWTIPVPSSSETSSHGITRCSTSAPGPSSSNGPE